jgi:hypothetical protein
MYVLHVDARIEGIGQRDLIKHESPDILLYSIPEHKADRKVRPATLHIEYTGLKGRTAESLAARTTTREGAPYVVHCVGVKNLSCHSQVGSESNLINHVIKYGTIYVLQFIKLPCFYER